MSRGTYLVDRRPRAPATDAMDRAVVASEEAGALGDIGGKARGLLDIQRAGLETAPWLVVRAGARPPDGRVTPELGRTVAAELRLLDPSGGGTFAVRSSGLDEDGAARSFAGQYATVLGVAAEAVPDAIERCWASAQSQGIRAYRVAAGLPADDGEIAVVVQCMVPAAFAGIAFSAAPDGGPDAVVVAAPGLGAALAAGREDGDEFRVGPDGATVTNVRQGRDGPWLDPADARRIADAARRLAAELGTPQDVEWCVTGDGRLVLVQTRPITALTTARVPMTGRRGSVRLWDNANIVESFPGLTLPLTFSIAREAYAGVYRAACRALGVHETEIRAEADAFENLLGHIRGRVYYDVGNWHRVLALLPAFRSNQALLERMMGATRPGAARGEAAAAVASRRIPLRAAVSIAWRLLAVVVTFERRARRFMAAHQRALRAAQARDVDAMTPAELLRHLDEVTADVLGNWQLPIFNDLAVMLFHGSLRRAAERWAEESAGEAINAMLRSGAHPGVAAAASLREIARAVRAEPEWLDALSDPDDDAVLRLAADPRLAGLRRLLAPYLAGWGGRAPGALHLDRPSLSANPGLLLVTIRDLALAEGVATRDTEPARRRRNRSVSPRLAVRGNAALRLLRTAILRFLVRRSRYHLTWRERMRLLRMDVFGIGREIVSAIDRAWVTAGVLEAPGDVHYLEVGEIRRAMGMAGASAESSAGMEGLGRLAARRRLEYEALRREPAPPNRFEADGPVPPARGAPSGADAREGMAGAGRLVGIGVSPGRAAGRAVVIREPRDAHGVAGRIVVAASTDPGWLPLMLAARGLVVEQGSLLSHSAIVARELGLPAVVGVSGATSALAMEPEVEVDGGAGTVDILDARPAAPRG